MLKSSLKKVTLLQPILPDPIAKILTSELGPIFMLFRFDHPDFQITGKIIDEPSPVLSNPTDCQVWGRLCIT
jgi:hypothetical protein